ncbi:MAG: hypothetical protein NT145_01115 [Elusimicrobia bacterium]|nr:hypothetical protein [Elusimicrobiota bacterium]
MNKINGVTQSATSGYDSYIVPLYDTAIALEAGLGCVRKIAQSVSVGFDVGYRIMSAKMKVSQDVDTDGDGDIDIKKGTVATHNGEELKFDFSGTTLQLSLIVSF